MKGPLITSATLHIILFIVAAVGMPFIAKEPIENFNHINVEIVDISDITQTNKLAPPQKKPEEEIKEPKPEPKKKPAPELTEPEPPKIEEKKAEPEPEAVKEEPKPKPKEKPKPPEKEKPKEEPKDDSSAFDSLLNDLTPEAEESARQELSQIASLGDKLTISERDAIGQQLYPCWNVPAGAKFAEDLAVEIRVFLNRDGTIRDTQILDSGRYNRDGNFRAAADSANRALRNPRCTPLKFPPDKYEQLKQFVFNFDPKDML